MNSSTRGLWIVVGVVLMAVGLSSLMSDTMGLGVMGHGFWGYGPMAPGRFVGYPWVWRWGFGGLLSLAFWGTVMVGVALLLRSRSGAPKREAPGTPIEVLKRRYAAGEITREITITLTGDVLATSGLTAMITRWPSLDTSYMCLSPRAADTPPSTLVRNSSVGAPNSTSWLSGGDSTVTTINAPRAARCRAWLT